MANKSSDIKTSQPSVGSAASPLIDQQIKKDWDPNLAKNVSTTANGALGKKHSNSPVKTGGGEKG